METSKKTSLILWSGIAAAATGIVAVAVISKWKERTEKTDRISTRLRDAQEILEDCYRKIHEIEERIPAMLRAPASERSLHPRPASNSAPLPEAV